ncbi:MAG: OmpA family protein [Bacteroidota bacterium]|nr:OmpA family protein [Bacteroidota bacterium]
MKKLFSSFLFLLTMSVFSQVKPPAKLQPTSCDCNSKIPIIVGVTAVYGPTQTPEGFGLVQEIQSKKKGDKQAFEKEHNSAWYILNIQKEGELVFDIVPLDSSNDYDFILYKYTDSSFCKDLLQKKISPVRSNISRNLKESYGLTGLSTNSKNEFAAPGPGSHLSSSLKVAKGERYVLVLDNVYPNGKGHRIFFNYVKEVEMSGVILDEKNVPVVAEVTLSDSKGNVVEQTQSDEKGTYHIKTPIKENVDYSLTFMNDSSFVSSSTINTKSLKNTSTFPDIKTVLPKLKKGGKYKLGNINFYGNAAIILPESYSSVESLYKLMKKNQKMVIQIEGHVNDPGGSSKGFNQKLSDERAMTIKNYLLGKGIEEERISTIGMSNKKMLFTKPKDEVQSSANRRVEINVISIE